MKLSDLIEVFKGHDKVLFKLTGIGETEYNTVDFKDAIDTIEALQQENERLDYTLIGVMHFVDKWLDDTDGMDEVNRAAKAREVALHAIETLEQENDQLRAKLEDWKHEVKCHMDEVIAREKQIEQLQAQAARPWEALIITINYMPDIGQSDVEALRKAREALITTIKGIDNKKIIPANADAAIELWRHKQQISNALDSKICWFCEHFAHFYASGGFCKIKTGDLPERAVDALDTCENFKEINRGGEE